MLELELRFIHREMGSLKDENHKQNMELASLKETVRLQNKTISQHETTIKHLIADNHRIIKSDHPVSSAAMTRRKRPAQLIPTGSDLYDERKKNDYNQNRNLFYGPPTNCSDLNRLGYTLNGFYMVQKPTNDEKSTHITVLDAVYCNFKQEKTFNLSLVEKPVLPSPFTAPLLPNHAFFSPILPPDDDVYFRFIAVRNKKDCSGVLTFDPSQFNKGNGFDGKTGYFKAPKFGIYHFLYEALLGSRGNGVSVDFFMNDVLIVNPLSTISQDSMSLQVTLKLKAGDSVCLKATIKSNSNHFSTVSYDVLSETVMGFLLKSTTFF